MAEQRKDFEQMIREDLQREAEEIREEVNVSGTEALSEEKKAEIAEKLRKRIRDYENEFAEEIADGDMPGEDIYAHLSEEDREALRLGKKLQGGRKRARRMYLVLAAAIVLILAFGMTSMGGAEKIAQITKSIVGEREVTKISSDEEDVRNENAEEEKAYQEIEETFGTGAVKIVYKAKRMEFVQMDLDDNFQVAELLYKYNNANLIYIITVDYLKSSFGLDVEDELIKNTELTVSENPIHLEVYRVKESGKMRCSASFEYRGLKYFLMGTMEEEEFVSILKNLYFF